MDFILMAAVLQGLRLPDSAMARMGAEVR